MSAAWDSLVADARAQMGIRQPATYAEFGLDFSMQYQWNLDRAEVEFSRQGQPLVRASLHYLGSITNPGGTWLWSWANDSIPVAATGRLEEIRDYGERHGYPKLTEPEWAPEGNDGHDVMLVSAVILDAPACFHDHYQNLGLFFVLDRFERLADGASQ